MGILKREGQLAHDAEKRRHVSVQRMARRQPLHARCVRPFYYTLERTMSDLNLDTLTSASTLAYLRSLLRTVPDFPKPGILFKDITPLLADPRGLAMTLDLLRQPFVGEKIDMVVGIEARGFIFGCAMAERLGLGFVPVRKPGKLPAEVDAVSYSLEYGTNELQMHKGSITKGQRVLVVDDLLATGGTAAATAQLVRGQGGEVAAFAFACELDFLNGRNALEQAAPGASIHSLLHID